MLQSDLCDNSDAYIAVKGTVTVIGAINSDRKNIILVLKGNAPFIIAYQRLIVYQLTTTNIQMF